jgi:hypothetical protein
MRSGDRRWMELAQDYVEFAGFGISCVDVEL